MGYVTIRGGLLAIGPETMALIASGHCFLDMSLSCSMNACMHGWDGWPSEVGRPACRGRAILGRACLEVCMSGVTPSRQRREPEDEQQQLCLLGSQVAGTADAGTPGLWSHHLGTRRGGEEEDHLLALAYRLTSCQEWILSTSADRVASPERHWVGRNCN